MSVEVYMGVSQCRRHMETTERIWCWNFCLLWTLRNGRWRIIISTGMWEVLYNSLRIRVWYINNALLWSWEQGLYWARHGWCNILLWWWCITDGRRWRISVFMAMGTREFDMGWKLLVLVWGGEFVVDLIQCWIYLRVLFESNPRLGVLVFTVQMFLALLYLVWIQLEMDHNRVHIMDCLKGGHVWWDMGIIMW